MSETFDELADLWARRDQLDQAEWTRLYELVMIALAGSSPREERSLALSAESAQNLLDSFFTDKVLLPATAGNTGMSRELTPGGLSVFYRNYLRDQLRKVKRRPEYQGYEGAEDELADETTVGNETDDGQHCPIDDSALADSLNGHSLRDSARDFLGEAEDWVVIYLALHFCHGRERLPLSKIHQQFQIPSYHYKARQLGIAPPRGGYEDWAEFGETMIGRWLTVNGVDLVPDQIALIRQAFDLLCMEAFREANARELTNLGELSS